MRRIFPWISVVLFLACFTQGAELSVGGRAPEFRLPGSDGEEYALSDFRGKQPVIISWFPKAFTGG